MRRFDWSNSALGPVERWPQSLRTAVNICLNSRFAILIWWGPELVMLYNDAYRQIIADKHPAALGRPGRECWHEIWHVIGPMLEGVVRTGQATWSDDLLLLLERRGYPEECYFTFSYSPISDESGAVGGVFTPVAETTDKIIGERRLRTLRDLGARGNEATTAEAAYRIATETLSGNPRDIPFAILYEVTEDRALARLAGTSGIISGAAATPNEMDLTSGNEAEAGWPLAETARSGEAQLVEGLDQRFGGLPGGDWPISPRSALVLPITPPGQGLPAGLLVVGVSPRMALDCEYRTFFNLVAGQVAAMLANALAHEEEHKHAEALAELDRAKTAFFSNISHEFRTPLTLMLGPLEQLVARSENETRRDLELVHRNGLRLLKLVNTLLDFSRIEAGRMQALYEPTDLSSYTIELASAFQSAVDAAGLKWTLDCPPLPEPVFVDRGLWEKIVLNLISNAFKFTLRGGIAVSLKASDGMVELAVSDTGSGIASDQLPHIFERFHTVRNNAARAFEGSGIGLALVQELVKLHGGSVRAEGALGRGSVFRVTLPLGSAHLPAERIGIKPAVQAERSASQAYLEEAKSLLPYEATGPVREPEETDEPPAAAWHARLLIVDDNADMRAYLGRLLSRGYEIETVGTGEAALQSARTLPPDLVLTDVMMPRMDGFELLQALRSDPRTRSIPVLLLSARAGEEARMEGLECGADDYLVKPFTARELLARVRTQLALSALRKETAEREQALRAEAEAARARMADILENTSDAYVAVDDDFRITYVNRAAESALTRSRDELLGRSLWEAYPGAHDTIFERECRRALEQRAPIAFEGSYADDKRWLEVRAYPGAAHGLAIYFRDISDRKRSEQLLRDQALLFEMMVQDRPLDSILERMAQLIEAHSDGTLASILLLDADGEHLRHGAASSLPETYIQAIDGVRIGPVVGSCGTAAFRGKSVFVEDIAADPLWKDYRASALAHGLRACWSLPILTTSGDVLGTFALYSRVQRMPSSEEVQLLEIMSKTAAIAIERSRDAAALRKSEELFRSLSASSPVGIFLTDLDGEFTYTNPRCQTICGFTAEEALGRGWARFVHQDDRGEIFESWSRRSLEGKDWSREIRFRDKLGATRWAHVRTTPMVSESGTLLGHVGTVEDITARSKFESALRESEDRLQLAIDAAELGTWDYFPLSGELHWSKRCKAIFGLAPDAEVDYPGFLALVHPDDRAGADAVAQAAMRGEGNGEYASDYRLVHPNGTVRWIVSKGRVIFNLVGGVKRAVRFAGTVMDISDRVRLEEQIRDTQKLESLGVLAGGIAHDFNNLLTGIIGNTSMALEDVPASNPGHRLIGDALRAGERAADLTRQLLAYSGKGQFVINRLNLSELVREISSLLRTSISKVVELRFELPEELPAIEADPGQIQQVIMNLVINGSEATAGSGGVVRIGTGLEYLNVASLGDGFAVRPPQSGRFVCMTVEDNGAGMDEALRAKIFDPFFTTKFTGRGLGLAAVLGIVRAHQGGISVRSEPGRGSTFRVYFPAQDGPIPASDGAGEAAFIPEAAGLVLVVDDEEIVRGTARSALERYGHRVILAENGQSALDLFEKIGAQVSVVLLDLSMPVMNGEQALEHLRRVRPDVPIILSSGFSEAEAVLRFAGRNLSGFLQKPYSSTQLLESVNRVLRSAGA